MRRRISDSVIVITGASSGIGRAAALAFSKKGASVVIAARREQPLREIVTQCKNLGGRALAVPTDVTDEAAVRNLARRAVEHFGRLDVWINNAAVTLFARFEDAPIEAYRRVIETKLFGFIHGARAALPYFREQGSGVLINNASLAAKLSQPYLSAYVAANHGVRGLSMSLRQELLLERAENIHVCTVVPASIDTPLYQHAGNYTGRAAKPLPPVYTPDQVAETFIRLAENPRHEVYVGNAARMLSFESLLAPEMTERQLAVMTDKMLLKDQPIPPTAGNLFEPLPEWTGIHGGWKVNGHLSLRRAAVAGGRSSRRSC
ncbi:MAG: SDR family oxidoreductase [Candidatus Manganitrophus sp.]|nr:MAG: SDR family oxidoreductase [Candidatus Manganitrophus sp.]